MNVRDNLTLAILPRISAATQKLSGGHAIAEKMGEAQNSWRS